MNDDALDLLSDSDNSLDSENEDDLVPYDGPADANDRCAEALPGWVSRGDLKQICLKQRLTFDEDSQ